MEKLSIDQILAEHRDDQPEVYNLEKAASAQRSKSEPFTGEDIEKMAGLLDGASLPEVNENFYEKLASAMILSETLQYLKKEEDVSCENTKLAEFKEEALKAGYNVSEVDAFIEKKAKMNIWGGLKNVLKGNKKLLLGGTAAAGASGYAGKEYGERQEREKTHGLLREVGQKAFRAGRGYQHELWRRRLSSMRGQQG